jgi:hypothetical protein
MWCYWIDQHLAKTEQSAEGWHSWAKNTMKFEASRADTEKAKGAIQDSVKFSMARRAPLGPEHMKWPSSAKGRAKKTSGYECGVTMALGTWGFRSGPEEILV